MGHLSQHTVTNRIWSVFLEGYLFFLHVCYCLAWFNFNKLLHLLNLTSLRCMATDIKISIH